jgi:hypothetical protein
MVATLGRDDGVRLAVLGRGGVAKLWRGVDWESIRYQEQLQAR